MNKKEKITIVCLIIIIMILAGTLFFLLSDGSKDNKGVALNNTTNITKNTTVVNSTVVSSESSGESGESSQSSSYESDPEFGSDEYVARWDESQQGDGSWAYVHDQPVKTDDDGNRYKRMYDEDTGEGYWYQMNQD